MEGGIPLLVELLDVDVINVQGAAARALRILAKKNNENKDQVEFTFQQVYYYYLFLHLH